MRNLPQHYKGCACRSAERYAAEVEEVFLLSEPLVIEAASTWLSEPYVHGFGFALHRVGDDGDKTHHDACAANLRRHLEAGERAGLPLLAAAEKYLAESERIEYDMVYERVL